VENILAAAIFLAIGAFLLFIRPAARGARDESAESRTANGVRYGTLVSGTIRAV
jgi:hypothetical protein